MSSSINYAKLFGFESVAAAAIFAVLYAPLCVWFIPLLIRRLSYVVFTLALFCQTRLVAFIIRAILANSSTAGENESLFIADEVLFSVGFFGLLYSAYGLVLDRLALCVTEPSNNPLNRITRNRMLFHLALSGGVILGIVGITKSTGSNPSPTGSVLRKASVIIFVVLTCLQAYQTLTLILAERSENENYRAKYIGTSLGARHGPFIFAAIALLLLVREIYMVATIGSTAKQNNEHTWYPLVALPELLCVALYAIPGIIPPKPDSAELPR